MTLPPARARAHVQAQAQALGAAARQWKDKGVKRLLFASRAAMAAADDFDRRALLLSARAAIGLERWRSGLVEKRLSIPGFELSYLMGAGPAAQGEPLVLLHGFGANKDNFTRVARFLTPRYRVLIPDLPGFGESSRPADASYGIADQVERVRAFVRGLGIERLHLGGSSMGGFIAAQYAASYPDEVSSLWLLGPAGTRAAATHSELSYLITEKGENPLLPREPAEFARTLEFVMHKRPFLPSSIRAILAQDAAESYTMRERIFSEIRDPLSPYLDDRLGGLATPSLVVWGRLDRVLAYRGAETYAALMANAEVILMDGIGHLPMLEAPARAARDYIDFRERLVLGAPLSRS